MVVFGTAVLQIQEEKMKLTKQTYSTTVLVLVIALLLLTVLRTNHGNQITAGVVGFQYVPPSNMDDTAALSALMSAQADVTAFSSFGLSTFFVNDTLLTAERYFIGPDTDRIKVLLDRTTDKDAQIYLRTLLLVAKGTKAFDVKSLNYSEVFRLTQLVTFRKEQAFRILDTISALSEKEKLFRSNGMNTDSALSLIQKAQASFKEERYDEAESTLEDASIALNQAYLEATRLAGVIKITSNFFQKYWLSTLIVVIILAVISVPASRKIKRERAKKRLAHLKVEIKSIEKLLKQAQTEFFKQGTITENTYKIREQTYQERMRNIRKEIPELEYILSGKKQKEGEENGSGAVLKIK